MLRSEEEAPYIDKPYNKIGTTTITETDKKNNPAPPDLILYDTMFTLYLTKYVTFHAKKNYPITV